MGPAQLSQINILQSITLGRSLCFSFWSGLETSSGALEFSVEQILYFLTNSFWKISVLNSQINPAVFTWDHPIKKWAPFLHCLLPLQMFSPFLQSISLLLYFFTRNYDALPDIKSLQATYVQNQLRKQERTIEAIDLSCHDRFFRANTVANFCAAQTTHSSSFCTSDPCAML